MKHVFLTLSMMLAVTILFAQDDGDDQKKIKKTAPGILFHGGFNFSGINGESESYNKGLPGPYAGFDFTLVEPLKNLKLNFGFFYSAEGSKYEFSEYVPGGMEVNSTGTVRLNYLRFPLVAHYGKEEGFYGRAGLRPGLLLTAKEKLPDETNDLKDNFNKFDMGLQISIGYQFKNNFGVNMGYAPGVSNINKKTGMYESVKDRNGVLFAGLHYRL
jgi:hypothetical protein